MELRNEFTVSVPVEQAWSVLTDVARVAPCIPGAELQEVEGDEYRGVVKLKVGPITAQYRGHARFLKQDAAERQAILRAEGRETRGQGNATATIVAHLVAAGEGTKVTIETDLAVTGRVAQFGRGVLAEVSNKLVGQFVESLETTVLAAPAQTAAGAATETAAATGVSPLAQESGEAEGAAAAPPPGAVSAGPESNGASAPVAGDDAGSAGATVAGGGGESTPAKELNVLALVAPSLVKRGAPLLVLLLLALFWRLRRGRTR